MLLTKKVRVRMNKRYITRYRELGYVVKPGDEIKDWDGYDYYDSEYIKDNFNLDPFDENYPNFDHKISTRHGFDNNIPINEIAHISNICITKRKINMLKYAKTEEEFLRDKKAK